MNFYELLVQQAEVYKDQPLLVTEAGTKTYRSLLAAVDAYAAGAAAYAPGAQVLVETEGVFGGLTAFLALQKKRAVPILQPRGMSADACAHLWEMLRARGTAPPCIAFGVLSSGSTGTPKIMLRSYQSWAGFFPVQNEVFAVDAATRLFFTGQSFVYGESQCAAECSLCRWDAHLCRIAQSGCMDGAAGTALRNAYLSCARQAAALAARCCCTRTGAAVWWCSYALYGLGASLGR